MDPITIDLLTVADAAEILAFERENRAYFAAFVPDRGDQYFQYDYLCQFLSDIVAEQERDECFMHLIRDASGELVGRVNLVDLQTQASIGYRIGQRYTGQGIATRAVGLALRATQHKHGLQLIQAMTTATNLGSQIVLLKNGFHFVRRTPLSLEVNGARYDAVHFERRLTAGHAGE